jgi:hypothetical protein
MKKTSLLFFPALFCLSLLSAQAPTITSITGYSDGVGVKNAKWTGQPSSCLPATGGKTNQFLNYYVVDCYNYGGISKNPYYWDIKGKNFGASAGSVSFVGVSGLNVAIVSWSNETIRIKPYANYDWPGISGGQIKVNKANNGGSVTFNISPGIIPILKSRGSGQCTYEVALRRIQAGKSIPLPGAYADSGSVNSSYVPARWDVLHWDLDGNGTLDHTGIITSDVKKTGTGDNTTYSFTVTERNAACNEKVATISCSFNPKQNKGIYSNASKTKQAKKYYR